jgi:hypothetical protein
VKAGRWVAARWQVLSAVVASTAGIGVAFLPWVRAPDARALDMTGVQSNLAAAWLHRNLSTPEWDLPDATVTLVLFGLALLGLVRAGLDRPRLVSWGWYVTAGLLVLAWFIFEVLVVGATDFRAGGRRIDAQPAIGIYLTGLCSVALTAVALAAVPASSRDETFGLRRG